RYRRGSCHPLKLHWQSYPKIILLHMLHGAERCAACAIFPISSMLLFCDFSHTYVVALLLVECFPACYSSIRSTNKLYRLKNILIEYLHISVALCDAKMMID